MFGKSLEGRLLPRVWQTEAAGAAVLSSSLELGGLGRKDHALEFGSLGRKDHAALVCGDG